MKKLEWYFAVLIGLFLVLAFYVGFISDTATVGGVINSLAKTLQGRNANGSLVNYPTNGRVAVAG